MTRDESTMLFDRVSQAHGTPAAFLAIGELRSEIRRYPLFFACERRERARRLIDALQTIVDALGYQVAA